MERAVAPRVEQPVGRAVRRTWTLLRVADLAATKLLPRRPRAADEEGDDEMPALDRLQPCKESWARMRHFLAMDTGPRKIRR